MHFDVAFEQAGVAQLQWQVADHHGVARSLRMNVVSRRNGWGCCGREFATDRVANVLQRQVNVPRVRKRVRELPWKVVQKTLRQQRTKVSLTECPIRRSRHRNEHCEVRLRRSRRTARQPIIAKFRDQDGGRARTQNLRLLGCTLFVVQSSKPDEYGCEKQSDMGDGTATSIPKTKLPGKNGKPHPLRFDGLLAHEVVAVVDGHQHAGAEQRHEQHQPDHGLLEPQVQP